MADRDAIIRELLAGAAPYGLSKKYPRATVYRIYNELLQSGKLHESSTLVIDRGSNEPNPFIPASTAIPTHIPSPPSIEVVEDKKGLGAEVVELGPKTLPLNAIERIRGILGLALRPKTLFCPMPELLYPAMVIAVTELGFKPMRPDDFIDTVLYQWLESCDYIPYAYMKRSELEEYASKYGLDIEGYAKEQGLMTAEEFAKKFNITLPQNGGEEVEKELPSEPDGAEESEHEELTEEEELEQAPFMQQVEENIGAIPIPEVELDKKEEYEQVEQEVVVESEAVEELREEINTMIEDTKVEVKETGDKPHKPTVGDFVACLQISNIQKNIQKEVK